MDKNQTSTAKSTPFSINDILTKNNTSIFRRRFSTEDLSPISHKSGIDHEFDHCDEPSDDLSKSLAKSMSFFKYPHDYLGSNFNGMHLNYAEHVDERSDKSKRRSDSDSPQAAEQSDENKSCVDDDGAVYKRSRNTRSSSVQYLNNNNSSSVNKNSGHETKLRKNSRGRRSSLDCFPIDKIHNGDNHIDEAHERFEDASKRHSHQLKMGFYNFPLMVETPLDMRRCADESGKLN